MNILLYRSKAKETSMDKTSKLELIDTINDYKLVGGANKTDLSLLIRKENGFTKEPNYAFIQEFNRFYFVQTINVINNNNYQLKLHCDVITTYKDMLIGNTYKYNKLYVKRTASPNVEQVHLNDELLVGSTKCEYLDIPITTTRYINETPQNTFNVVCVSAKGVHQ